MAKIHQIKIDFHVTPEIKRYVYMYLIEGKNCYLIDSGVDGAEKTLVQYMEQIGRKPQEIKAVFLTHAHPDHIGAAAKIKGLTGCKVYASEGEKSWIENIDLQFAQRPIPNFFTLVNQSVQIDEVLQDGDIIELDEAFTVQVVGTPGHSCDELSYLLPEEHCIFTGDAIPVRGDIPIWIQKTENRKSLEKLKELTNIDVFYPAWDVAYTQEQAMEKIEDALALMDEMQKQVDICKNKELSLDELVREVCERMQTPFYLKNPLFQRTIQAMKEE
ncbi:MAG: MBL fold metallo-hydrolase [Lachnospiraceae bacterium]